MDVLDQEKYINAKKKVEEIKGFYGHLVSFVLVMLILVVINLTTSPQYLWFFWPLLGWGIGVVIHGLKTFDIIPFFNKEWEERKIQEYMEKEKQQKENQKWQ